MPRSRNLLAKSLFAGLGLCAVMAVALAQEAPPDLLAGPIVDAEATIVRHGMDGRLVSIDGRPEIAAVQMLLPASGLPPEVSERVRTVIAARGETMRLLLVDELDTVRTVTDLITAGESEAARDEMWAMWGRFEPDRSLAPLLDDLAVAIGSEHAPKLRSMVSEYFDALLRERLADRMDDEESSVESDDPVVVAARERLAFELFQAEIRTAYTQTLRRYHELLQSIYAAVEPTEEQRALIRDTVLGHIKRTQLQASPQQRRETMLTIYRQLDEDQREKLYEALLQQLVPG